MSLSKQVKAWLTIFLLVSPYFTNMAYCLLLTICVSPDHPYKNKIPLDCDPGPVWSEASSVSRCEGGEAGETRGALRAGPGTRRLGLSQTGTLRLITRGPCRTRGVFFPCRNWCVFYTRSDGDRWQFFFMNVLDYDSTWHWMGSLNKSDPWD